MENGELSFEEVAKKYPDFPRPVLRKIDTALRGVILSEKALERAKEEGAFYDASRDFGENGSLSLIGGLFFRDGTYVLGIESVTRGFHSPSNTLLRKGRPYLLDVIDDKLWLLDLPHTFAQDESVTQNFDAHGLPIFPQAKVRGENPLEEVYFAPIPQYFRKKTSRGTPMIKIISSRPPNRISLNISSGYCHFFKEKLPCKFCNVIPWSLQKGIPPLTNLEDIYETVNETLEEEGGFTSIHLIAGSDPRGMHQSDAYQGNSAYKNEADNYIRVLEVLQRCFGTEKIPVQAIASAFPQEQLFRLKEEGLSAYRSNIEVWDEKLFNLVCPGKAKYFGREYWIESILSAVEVFGRGNVSTQIVAGAELAQPYGFKTIEEALESSLEGVEFFARYGVYTTFCILWIDRGSVFYREKQKLPPLEYYVKLAQGINEIRRKYNLSADFNDYRRDGFHPDLELARIDYAN